MHRDQEFQPGSFHSENHAAFITSIFINLNKLQTTHCDKKEEIFTSTSLGVEYNRPSSPRVTFCVFVETIETQFIAQKRFINALAQKEFVEEAGAETGLWHGANSKSTSNRRKQPSVEISHALS
jgi:hypothetical protein